MNYKTLRHVLLGFGLLASLSAGAQEFDSELQLSGSDDIIYWYRICSAATGMDGYAMTDLCSETEDIESSFIYMLQTETEDYRSQWKLTAGKETGFWSCKTKELDSANNLNESGYESFPRAFQMRTQSL